MKKYPIKKCNIDFEFEESLQNAKGTRRKRLVRDLKDSSKAFFKYQGDNYITSELCSEKICYEIAKVLDYDCAKIELAKDENGEIGVLNYIFIKEGISSHTDIGTYLNPNGRPQKDFYTLDNIKVFLDSINMNLWFGFIKIMIFDALVGEQDRHEENWGISYYDGEYRISPLYDNGCNLLDKFKDESYAKKFYDNEEKFDQFINRSHAQIRKADSDEKYRHFELIKKLNEEYKDVVQNELKKLEKLNDKTIKRIVDKVPDEMLTEKHKEYIIKYLKKRRDILLSIK